MAVDINMVIHADGALTPFAELVGRGWQRLQGGALNPIEQPSTAGAKVACDAIIEALRQFSDRLVQLAKREEAPVSKSGDDPALYDLNANLDLRIRHCLSDQWRSNGSFLGFAHPRRNDGGVVMCRQIGIGAPSRCLKANPCRATGSHSDRRSRPW